jgi:hypothetical protein
MSTARCTLIVALCMLVPAVLPAQQASNASGMLKVNGVATELHFAYAFRDGASTRVLLTPEALPAELLDEEAGLRDNTVPTPFRDSVVEGQASAIELLVEPDGAIRTVKVFHEAFPGPTPTSGPNAYWSEPYRMQDGWIGGRSRTKQQQEFFDTKWEYEVSYFAPVGKKTFDLPSAAAIDARRSEIEAREGRRIVPPGGGEEGAMYLAFFANLEAGNPKALLAQMTPAMVRSVAEWMQVAELSSSDIGIWAMSLTTPPGPVEILGGVRDPEGTLLELRRTAGSRVKFGTARIVKDGGEWKVAEQEW